MCGTDLKRKEAVVESEKLLAAANSRQARRAIVGEWGGSMIFKSPLLKYRRGSACVTCGGDTTVTRNITERTQAPSGVAAFMSAHGKTPYITLRMDSSSEMG